MSSQHHQVGYLLEVPLIMAVAGIGLAVLLPMVPVLVGKVLLVGGAAIYIACFYYEIVTPGWRPGPPSRLNRTGRLIVFALVVILIVIGTGAYVVYQ